MFSSQAWIFLVAASVPPERCDCFLGSFCVLQNLSGDSAVVKFAHNAHRT